MAVEIPVILKIVSLLRTFRQRNVHYIPHVLIVIVNNVHRFINIKNHSNISLQIHQRQIQRLIEKFRQQRISSIHRCYKLINNHYQLVDPIHILNHYRKVVRRFREKNLQSINDDDDIYLVIVHFGIEHNNNNKRHI